MNNFLMMFVDEEHPPLYILLREVSIVCPWLEKARTFVYSCLYTARHIMQSDSWWSRTSVLEPMCVTIVPEFGSLACQHPALNQLCI